MQVLILTDSEIDDLIYMREFVSWYRALSQQARNHINKLPEEVRLSIAKTAVQHRLKYEFIESVIAAPTFLDNRLILRAA